MTSFELEGYLRDLFSNFGDISSISISKFNNEESKAIPNSRFAHITFASKRVKKILATGDDFFESIMTSVVSKWGLSISKRTKKEILEDYYLKDIDPVDLQSEVNSFMIDFEESEKVISANIFE